MDKKTVFLASACTLLMMYGIPMWSLTGRMEIWSDEIPESKRGTSKVDFQI